jgi:catalase
VGKSNAAPRPLTSKGIVCEGTFTATPAAATLSRAAHFQGKPVPVTIRFSDGAPDPSVPDNSPNASPRGVAIRFMLPGGDRTDIVAISHNGFIVGSGEEFLALEKVIVATDPSKPHPWAIEQFLGTHPRALKFVQDPNPTPESFATGGILFQQCVRLREQERCETSRPVSDYFHLGLALPE